MVWSMATLARISAVLTLVIAAFLVAPVTDAAACAPEPLAAHQSLDHDPSAGDHNGSGGDMGLCSHGHCHHTASERHVTDEIDSAELSGHTTHAAPLNDGPASFPNNGLKRPPRG
ncbi:hypothetical protein EJ082_16285 [Brevundimonas diminuta]|uniref:Secreted protein n=1 Tax=Brevundimonas diminuta TaxID=293 RepID=A0A410NZL1_BREDI|nr:hypothetical protein [Brevundimonas diminuta]QAT15251.1 hypothetical protein EQG53_13350 [Brevundimonas diminuta]QQB87363.1 hypothetical protein I6H83_09115 [Brevundimonas diminuta]GEC02251.1 hypothetical protein BDI01nite_33150 [Brevundimonas diminuta]